MKRINNKGFTLIEVLAVVAIIAILGIIAIPNVLNTVNSGKDVSYNILIKNTKTASQQLFEEIENNHSKLYYYTTSEGNTGSDIKIKTTKDDGSTQIKQITINFQTLVSNGFLTGTNNDSTNGTNKNSKIILNPKTSEDMGHCNIKVTKTVAKSDNYKTSYSITSETNDENCPTTEEYK